DLEGSTAATSVPAIPVGVRAARARTVRSTIAIQTPVTQGRAPIAQGGAPISIQTSIAKGGASISIQTSIAKGG
ncbi:hypothetical protein N321_09120, partial [Antrostomus carolinensis]